MKSGVEPLPLFLTAVKASPSSEPCKAASLMWCSEPEGTSFTGIVLGMLVYKAGTLGMRGAHNSC